MVVVARAEWPEDFVIALVEKHAELMPVLDQHLKDHGELLPHMFLGDTVRFLTATYADPREAADRYSAVTSVMMSVGSHFASSSLCVKELIAASFLENMPYPHEEAAEMIELLPDNLKSELIMQRGGLRR